MQRLRERKRRDRKPFAVLFANLSELAAHADVDDAASLALRSPAAPIVLLKRRESSTLAGAVALAWEPWVPSSPTLPCTGP